jgi:hypothetical protein
MVAILLSCILFFKGFCPWYGMAKLQRPAVNGDQKLYFTYLQHCYIILDRNWEMTTCGFEMMLAVSGAGERVKRQQTSVRNTCLLFAIADFRFFTSVGGSKRSATANFMVYSLIWLFDIS